jgi:hypothetical protein
VSIIFEKAGNADENVDNEILLGFGGGIEGPVLLMSLADAKPMRAGQIFEALMRDMG